MDVLKPEDLTECPDHDKELNRDSYLSPTFSSHGESVAGSVAYANRQGTFRDVVRLDERVALFSLIEPEDFSCLLPGLILREHQCHQPKLRLSVHGAINPNDPELVRRPRPQFVTAVASVAVSVATR